MIRFVLKPLGRFLVDVLAIFTFGMTVEQYAEQVERTAKCAKCGRLRADKVHVEPEPEPHPFRQRRPFPNRHNTGPMNQ